MEGPTLTGRRVRSGWDARLIFHAVAQQKLPLIVRRLTNEERKAYIRAGSVFVWEERGPTSQATGGGIERWTDGKHWSPSRLRGEFLVYTERSRNPRKPSQQTPCPNSQDRLIKQTFSVWVNKRSETRKWHLVSYYTTGSVSRLGTIDGLLDPACLPDLEEKYRSARSTKGRHREEDLLYELQSPNPHPFGSPEHQLTSMDLIPTTPTVPPAWDGDTFTPINCWDDQQRPVGGDRTLAPLVYLESVSPPPRPSVDDSAIRALDSIMQ